MCDVKKFVATQKYRTYLHFPVNFTRVANLNLIFNEVQDVLRLIGHDSQKAVS